MLLDASSAATGWLDSPHTPHLAGAPCTGWKRKKKEVLEGSRTLPRELEELMHLTGPATLGGAGRRWTIGTALDRRRLARTAAALLDGLA